MKYRKLYDYLKVYFSDDWEWKINSGYYEFHPNFQYRNWIEQMLEDRHNQKLIFMGLPKDEMKKGYMEAILSSKLEKREKDICDWFWEKEIRIEIFTGSPMDRQYYIWWYTNNIESESDEEIKRTSEIKEKQRMAKLYKKYKSLRKSYNKFTKSLKVWE